MKGGLAIQADWLATLQALWNMLFSLVGVLLPDRRLSWLWMV